MSIFKKGKEKLLGNVFTNIRRCNSRMTKKLLEAVMKGEMVSVKPSSFSLRRNDQHTFAITLNDETGSPLVEVMEFQIGVGDSITFSDVHRVFEIKLSQA
jgi:hypothetical protein